MLLDQIVERTAGVKRQRDLHAMALAAREALLTMQRGVADEPPEDV